MYINIYAYAYIYIEDTVGVVLRAACKRIGAVR